MPILLILFILVPIIEIGVFIQVGGFLGLWPTLLIVLVTAVLGVNLLKQQGLRAWMDIQTSMAQGKVPAVEMASAAQLLFAGGLLLTPGFVTDGVGFALMVPAVRLALAQYLMNHWAKKATVVSSTNFYYTNETQRSDGSPINESHKRPGNRTIEGEFEDRSDK
ncbi:FxsA family protein [Aliikangiella marina]|uniref:FxsA family protein n=1 Tax=Aliikangiella marina TaxID=1712262 RepID=A0A545T129_9GAMM|nr:FxsA family protein [Aliikangiella marina]TQV70899.1 FxsA family protein [Aliikangiella marina]